MKHIEEWNKGINISPVLPKLYWLFFTDSVDLRRLESDEVDTNIAEQLMAQYFFPEEAM